MSLSGACRIHHFWNSNEQCGSAAASGNIELMKWLREKGCPWNYTCVMKLPDMDISIC